MRLFIHALLGMYFFYQMSFITDQAFIFVGGSILYIITIMLDGCDAEYTNRD